MIVSLLLSLAQAAPGLEAGAYTGLIFIGPKHELYDSAGGAEWKRMGPGVPLGLRGGLYPVDFLGVEGELHAGISPIKDAGMGLITASRLHAIVRLDPMLGDLALRPHFAAGGGVWGVRSGADALGRDADRQFYVGPGARMALTDTMSLRADLRYLFVARQGTGESEFGGSTELLFGLVMHAPPPAPPIDPATLDDDGDGALNGVDACPSEAETQNGYKDEDGCPDVLGKVEIAIVDEAGAGLAGATVTVDGKPAGTTGPNGLLALSAEQMPGSKLEISATHPGGGRGNVTFSVQEGANRASLALVPVLGRVNVTARDAKGNPIDALVKAQGPSAFKPVQLGADGEEDIALPVGDWQLFITAEGMGTERRDVSVREGEVTKLPQVDLKPSRAVVARAVVDVKEKINFDTDGYSISASSLPVIDAIATIMLEHPDILKLEVGGHTDDRGDDAYNLDLSQKRVDSVVAALTQRGVPASRLVAKGYGETKPIGDNKTAAGRDMNRRVEFNIVQREE